MVTMASSLLRSATTIAVVGFSDKPARESHRIGTYLMNYYKVYPVNPSVSEIDGHKVYPSLDSLPEKVDIVNVFRRSDALDGVVEEAIKAGAKSVWAQLGVSSDSAQKRADAANLPIIMDTCIFIEHQKLLL